MVSLSLLLISDERWTRSPTENEGVKMAGQHPCSVILGKFSNPCASSNSEA